VWDERWKSSCSLAFGRMRLCGYQYIWPALYTAVAMVFHYIML
jgi:hypothetical protein